MAKSSNGAYESTPMGVLGAFLFSLLGGVAHVLFSFTDYSIFAIGTGYLIALLALIGYEKFTYAKTMKGIKVSAIVASVVLVLSWYIGFVIGAYNFIIQFEENTLNSIWEYIPYSFLDIVVDPKRMLPLFLGMIGGTFAMWQFYQKWIKEPKNKQQDNAPKEKPRSLHHIDD